MFPLPEGCGFDGGRYCSNCGRVTAVPPKSPASIAFTAGASIDSPPAAPPLISFVANSAIEIGANCILGQRAMILVAFA